MPTLAFCGRHLLAVFSRSQGACSARAHATLSSRRWGVVLDIDGVLLRGSSPIPGSAEALRMLREADVPFTFMTNGGGMTEERKAAELAERMGEPVDASQMLLAHTPMRDLADRYRNRRVVVVGGKETTAVAQSYGFDFDLGMAVTPAQIAAGTHGIYPQHLSTPQQSLPPVDVNQPGAPPIEAVLLFYDTSEWGMELQILTDALAGGSPLGSGHGQVAELYAANPDFLWQADYPASRYGMGAYLECLKALWTRRFGTELRVNEFGKPHGSQFQMAQRMLSSVAGTASKDMSRIYMVGDNPAADVRGANRAGGPWRSVMVCTGVYKGGRHSNDASDPAWRVEPDLRSTVERLLSMSEDEHAFETNILV
ncbi:unnamed protein product [Polarella glacialis]|uniref:Uncharacterized protein n=1 Tax=Polarella glacialis TaxID=89957 RepID=A0A813F179_POLGL|nr:unnamed protein product [Polarella glacialis]CAE8720532.1 unnamed protein product [Polarella glacialis]|mmetsp:Transcript_5998/g.11254  ORF Transcript_5998/g.11254 Transcript_5998/m.11254 type:complete len:368 (+) Transcript_5998:61-1164(+)